MNHKKMPQKLFGSGSCIILFHNVTLEFISGNETAMVYRKTSKNRVNEGKN